MAAVERDHWWFRAKRALVAEIGAGLADEGRCGLLIDVGCGTGALVEEQRGQRPAVGVDLDETALACARRTGGFTVHQGSWWSGLPSSLAGGVDLAVAYLPHVPTSRLPGIHQDFRAHEPVLSVDGGADGLDPLRAVLADADRWLARRGAFVTLVSREQATVLDLAVLASDEDDVVVAHQRPSRSSNVATPSRTTESPGSNSLPYS
jgi:release factor glutamine methyltransferase